jgi:hypothetical protein
MLKRLLLCSGFIIASASGTMYASVVHGNTVINTHQQVDDTLIFGDRTEDIKRIAQTTYSGLITGKDYVVTAVKKHPFIALTLVIMLLSKKTRKGLWNLPQGLWQDIQEYPIAMALLGGFLLNYIIA